MKIGSLWKHERQGYYVRLIKVRLETVVYARISGEKSIDGGDQHTVDRNLFVINYTEHFIHPNKIWGSLNED